MPIPVVSKAQMVEVLREIGVGFGDGLLVHSALQFLGKPENGPQTFLDALLEVVGPGGTIAVPAFNFGFARGLDYDPALAPAEKMGVFSEFLRQQPGVKRTRHPMQSLAIQGAWAHEIALLDTPSAFEEGSVFDHLLKHDFKLLLLGAEVQAASIVHYSEQRARVPYRFWKDFTGRIKIDGRWQTRTYRMFVRDLELDPHLHLQPIEDAMKANEQWTAQELNYGQVALGRLKDFVAAADDLLQADPWALIGNRKELGV